MTRLPDHFGVQRSPSEDGGIESVNFLTKLPGEATDRKGQLHVVESHRLLLLDQRLPYSAETDHQERAGSESLGTLGRFGPNGRRAVLPSAGPSGRLIPNVSGVRSSRLNQPCVYG